MRARVLIAIACLALAGGPLAAPARAGYGLSTPMMDVQPGHATVVNVAFAPAVGAYFPRVVALVLGLETQPAQPGDTWTFVLPDAGQQAEYARLFQHLPYVQRVAEAPPPLVEAPDPGYVPGEVLVKFKTGIAPAEIERFNAQQGVTVLDKIPGIEVWRLKLPPGKAVEAMVRLYQASGLVEYAEPNHRVSVPTLPGLPPARGTWKATKVKVVLAPGASLELVNLVFGTTTLSTAPGGFYLSPAPDVPPALQAHLLRLCPAIQRAEAAS